MPIDKIYIGLVDEGEWLLSHQINSGSQFIYNTVDKGRYNTWAMNCISLLDSVAEKHAQRIEKIYSPEHATVNIVEQILGIVRSAIVYINTQDQRKSVPGPQRASSTLSNDIFIVHGKDDEMKQSVART